MLPNQNLRDRYIHIPVSPPRTFSCPYCSRCLHSKGGRTRHFKAKHSSRGLGPHEPSPSPSQESSSSELYHERTQSPFPSDSMPSPPPSSNSEEPDAGHDPDINHLTFDPDHTLLEPYVQEPIPNPPHGDRAHDKDPPRATRVYHPKLSGESRYDVSLHIF